jgi:hypothetical protein
LPGTLGRQPHKCSEMSPNPDRGILRNPLLSPLRKPRERGSELLDPTTASSCVAPCQLHWRWNSFGRILVGFCQPISVPFLQWHLILDRLPRRSCGRSPSQGDPPADCHCRHPRLSVLLGPLPQKSRLAQFVGDDLAEETRESHATARSHPIARLSIAPSFGPRGALARDHPFPN